MFALGIGGWLSITAIPLFILYSLLALTLSISIYLINRSSQKFRFNLTFLPLASYTLIAWLTSIALFFLLGALNYNFTQYSGNTILKLYPIIQQIVGVLMFYLLCKSCLVKKTGQAEISTSKRNLLSAGVAVIPTAIFVLAVNILHLLR